MGTSRPTGTVAHIPDVFPAGIWMCPPPANQGLPAQSVVGTMLALYPPPAWSSPHTAGGWGWVVHTGPGPPGAEATLPTSLQMHKLS